MTNNGTAVLTKRAPSAEEASTTAVRLKRLDRITFDIPIEGVTPLIVNRWSEKAKEMLLRGQQETVKPKKEPKDPVACFQASRFRLDEERDGFPATGFKAAIVHAGRLFEGITQVLLKQITYVQGEGPQMLVPLDYGEMTMREDTPRNASGVVDLRYRAQYWPWSATLKVSTIAGQLDRESVLALVDAAGIGGVGEWRPTSPKSATGTYGTFRVIEGMAEELSFRSGA